MPRTRPDVHAQAQEIVAKRLAGRTIPELAREYHCSNPTIEGICAARIPEAQRRQLAAQSHANAIAPHRPYCSSVHEKLDEIITRWRAGGTAEAMAKEYGCSPSTIKDMLRKLCGKEPSDQLDPDQVVAHGAAIHASILAAKAGEGTLPLEESIKSEFKTAAVINVNSHNLGIEANRPGKGTVSSVLIPKNTQIPCAQSRVFYLPAPGMTKVQVRVLEGDAEEAAFNTCIGDCWITGLPPGLPKKAPVQVRLAYGADGRVGVMALDMTHGTFAKAEIERGSKLTDDDIRCEAAFVAKLEIH